MRRDRILTEELRSFMTNPAPNPNRDYLIDCVRESLNNGTKSIALCFRGTAATLYYRCHQLLRIRRSRKAVIGEFDFRHARFTGNYQQILADLTALRVDISDFSDKNDDTPHRYVRFDLDGENAVTQDELKEIIKIYKKLIDEFLDPEKTEYAFDPKAGRRKSNNLEKDRQQQLYAAYFLHDDLTYYDLEYTEHNAAANGVRGRFDLLGLRREGDGYALLFTELKSTSQACSGQSGVSKHEQDTVQYLDSELIANRKVEACETVKLLCEIFGKPYPENLTPDNIKRVKGKFVFSDHAIGVGERYIPQDDRIEKAYLCERDGTEKPY